MTESSIILPICPQTWVKFKSGKGGDQVLNYIPLECSRKDKVTGKEEDRGQPCDEWLESGGFCPHTLSEAGRYRKNRIDKYNKYREDLFHLAKKAKFELPVCGWSLYFYFPMPVRWPKKKKALMHGQFHMQRPDESNCLKAFEDALSVKDEYISQMSGLGKFWFNPDLVDPRLKAGYIEIRIDQPLYNPFNVTFIEKDSKITMVEVAKQKKLRDKQKAAAREKRKKDGTKSKKRTPKPLKILPQEKLFKKKDNIQ